MRASGDRVGVLPGPAARLLGRTSSRSGRSGWNCLSHGCGCRCGCRCSCIRLLRASSRSLDYFLSLDLLLGRASSLLARAGRRSRGSLRCLRRQRRRRDLRQTSRNRSSRVHLLLRAASLLGRCSDRCSRSCRNWNRGSWCRNCWHRTGLCSLRILRRSAALLG